MLVNNVVTSSAEFFEEVMQFEQLPLEVMFLIAYEEGTAIIRYTRNQMPSLPMKDDGQGEPDTTTPYTEEECIAVKDAWMEQLKMVAQLSKNCTLKGLGATASTIKGFKGICKLFYNA